MDRRAVLAEFLRSRRARLRPDELGLPEQGHRRVPGLRREELAMLAGVSVDHYVRLEQGRTLHYSAAVLDAVAGALRLDEDERQHLYRLARPSTTSGRPREQIVQPGLQRLLDSMTDVPAYIVGRRVDVLAWNALAAALITDFGTLTAQDCNFARLVFTDESIKELFCDWHRKADDVVAYLRLDAGRHPDDPRLADLVAELQEASPYFCRLWAEYPVRDKTRGHYWFRHPVVGDLELAYETLRVADDPDQALITYTVAAGSPSETSLRLLAAIGPDRNGQTWPRSSPAG
ncbi:helix-turn-helix domain-containing protein [Streptomyces sp. TRM66268-LWL]|uniref:Helix-turn-helix domain-containing protein n=1 Tax=Streptomyces polyasparticus TaxID=2767826 RepID=A0ABR7SDB6_9ACTN|nr:helix-turn-helix transcriptional regulator [Streptomyces polyasparticus]MBC9713497.1 helix-turn-helix domain-containing protein [Streptomyces polyasparticus]